jgi:hypothetical protein
MAPGGVFLKSSKLIVTVVFACFVLLASAVAQTPGIKASVPFPFSIGKQTLPAGDYRISVKGDLLQLTRLDGNGTYSHIAFPTGAPNNAEAGPSLVFHRYGDQYFLSSAWISEGYGLYSSPKQEKQRAATYEEKVVVASRIAVR